MNYRSKEGDVVDALAKRIYGNESMVVAIYEANPGLADLGAVLPAGLLINLPDPPVVTQATTVVRLWGAA